MRDAKQLFGPWANTVPSARNFNWNSPSIALDFGTKTMGYEMPYVLLLLLLLQALQCCWRCFCRW